jgi:hypothetical protein
MDLIESGDREVIPIVSPWAGPAGGRWSAGGLHHVGIGIGQQLVKELFATKAGSSLAVIYIVWAPPPLPGVPGGRSPEHPTWPFPCCSWY